MAPNTRVVCDKRWVDNGKIVTSGGPSAGIDASLHVVAKVKDKGSAQFQALGMEYAWDSEGGNSHAALADRYMRFRFTGLTAAKSLSRSGTRDWWESKWLVSNPAAAQEILDRMNETLAKNNTHGPPSKIAWVRQDPQPHGPRPHRTRRRL